MKSEGSDSRVLFHDTTLTLRSWEPGDLAAFVRLHTDPELSAWLGGPLQPEVAEGAFHSIREHFRTTGWGLWAIVDARGEVVGAAGLQTTKTYLPFQGVEALWRLLPSSWGAGYVTRSMREILRDGFEQRGFSEIVSFTARTNLRSQAVMRRLGFVPEPQTDFDHPRLPEHHPLRPHVFYRLARAQWDRARSASQTDTKLLGSLG